MKTLTETTYQIAQQIKLSNDGPVSQTGEGVTTSETLSNHRALNGTGLFSFTTSVTPVFI